MATEFTQELDSYRHHNYRLVVRLDPSVNDVRHFAVVLLYETPAGDRVSVARIDNSATHGGQVHLDRDYRSDDAKRKKWDIDVESWHEAIAYFETRWRTFADIHAENHG